MNKREGCLLALVLVATSAWGAFTVPPENERLRALGNLADEPAELRPLLVPHEDFPPIMPPRPNDWLAAHTERGQTFEEYRTSGANRPDETRRTIYLLPIGEFPEETSPPLEELRVYAAAFFQMPVKILPAYFPHDLEFEPRENPRTGRRQVLTGRIMDFLKTRLPEDAYCLLGVTMTDLYPSRSWNYVFGQASLSGRVGIYSFARDDPAFWDQARPPAFRELILRRSCKILTHETAHMFGLQHCIYYQCVVNGSNGLAESDASPQHLCPVCLRKMHHATGFDAIRRYKDLALFYRRQKWFEESDWVQRQLGRISPPARAIRP